MDLLSHAYKLWADYSLETAIGAVIYETPNSNPIYDNFEGPSGRVIAFSNKRFRIGTAKSRDALWEQYTRIRDRSTH